MRLLVTRPQPDASRQAERLAQLGHQAIVSPVLKIVPLPDVQIELDALAACIVTSRNALRAIEAHPARAALMMLPLFAVGAATALAAESQGFQRVTEGPGTGAELAALIARCVAPASGVLLHLSGEDLSFDMGDALGSLGFQTRRAVVYRAEAAVTLSVEAREAIEKNWLDGVLLMSPRTARIYTELTASPGLRTHAARVGCYCLSEAVAAHAPVSALKHVAPVPREEALLALLGGGKKL